SFVAVPAISYEIKDALPCVEKKSRAKKILFIEKILKWTIVLYKLLLLMYGTVPKSLNQQNTGKYAPEHYLNYIYTLEEVTVYDYKTITSSQQICECETRN